MDDAVLAELRAENERLVIKANAEHIARQNAEAENGRLRTLVGDMFVRLEAAEAASDMGWIDSRLAERAHELGVEV